MILSKNLLINGQIGIYNCHCSKECSPITFTAHASECHSFLKSSTFYKEILKEIVETSRCKYCCIDLNKDHGLHIDGCAKFKDSKKYSSTLQKSIKRYMS